MSPFLYCRILILICASLNHKFKFLFILASIISKCFAGPKVFGLIDFAYKVRLRGRGRFIFAAKFSVEMQRGKYTKLIKIQLGKKFSPKQ